LGTRNYFDCGRPPIAQNVSKLHVAFDKYLEGKSCDVFQSPFDVTLKKKGKWNVVQPDLLIICNWQKDVDAHDRYRGIPKLVVEVISPSSQFRDTILKLNLYMHAGIEEYWLISPTAKDCIVYRFEDNQIKEAASFSEGDVCKSFIYEGFEWMI
jgi:Uma2 family endonuclease